MSLVESSSLPFSVVTYKIFLPLVFCSSVMIYLLMGFTINLAWDSLEFLTFWLEVLCQPLPVSMRSLPQSSFCTSCLNGEQTFSLHHPYLSFMFSLFLSLFYILICFWAQVANGNPLWKRSSNPKLSSNISSTLLIFFYGVQTAKFLFLVSVFFNATSSSLLFFSKFPVFPGFYTHVKLYM